MSIYFGLYVLTILSLLHVGYLVYGRYSKTLHGKYLLATIMSLSLWLTCYITIYSTNFPPEILIWFSRLLYSLGLIVGHFMLGFAFFFGIKRQKREIYNKIHKFAIIALLIIVGVTLFSPYIIKEMIYDNDLLHHYEDLGILFNLYAVLYILNPLAFIVIARKRISKLKGVSKVRLKYISIGYVIFILNWIIFLGILPIFGIWIMQKEQIVFFIPFMASIYYTIQRYYFIDPFISIGRAFISINALLFSFLLTNQIYAHYTNKIGTKFENYWGIENDFGFIHISIGVLLYFLAYNFLTKHLLTGTSHDSFVEKLEKIKSRIPFITNINDLNIFLRNSFNSSLNIGNTHIELLKTKGLQKSEIYNFFKGNIKNKYFLNDIVFIEENKHKFQKKKLKNEITKNTSLILPIKRGEEVTGTLILGHKPLKDIYSTLQIQELEKFTRFLTGHLKYLDMYKDIHSLNINLDKKVDEKTMEYNNLISKQKEFISVVSHEMRSPITTAIFQTDCLIDDVEAGKYEKKYLESELKGLYSQLTRSSDLVKKLFSVEKYDINKFSLFKEKIDFYDFLKKEIYHFSKNHPKIEFDINIDKNIGELKIDQVQFRQVIDNLINNAIKFTNKDKPKISFSAEGNKTSIKIKVEDNGKGFQDADISSIFDKYFTGKSSGIGIGIGLYLCKKIVEFHDGTIEAKFSKKLGGGKFVITIPK